MVNIINVIRSGANVNFIYNDVTNASPLIYCKNLLNLNKMFSILITSSFLFTVLENNQNNLDIVKALMNAGADPNYQDANFKTALMFGIQTFLNTLVL